MLAGICSHHEAADATARGAGDDAPSREVVVSNKAMEPPYGRHEERVSSMLGGLASQLWITNRSTRSLQHTSLALSCEP